MARRPQEHPAQGNRKWSACDLVVLRHSGTIPLFRCELWYLSPTSSQYSFLISSQPCSSTNPYTHLLKSQVVPSLGPTHRLVFVINFWIHFFSPVLTCLFLIHLFHKSPHLLHHHSHHPSLSHSFIPDSGHSSFANPSLHRSPSFRTDLTDTGLFHSF